MSESSGQVNKIEPSQWYLRCESEANAAAQRVGKYGARLDRWDRREDPEGQQSPFGQNVQDQAPCRYQEHGTGPWLRRLVTMVIAPAAEQAQGLITWPTVWIESSVIIPRLVLLLLRCWFSLLLLQITKHHLPSVPVPWGTSLPTPIPQSSFIPVWIFIFPDWEIFSCLPL